MYYIQVKTYFYIVSNAVTKHRGYQISVALTSKHVDIGTVRDGEDVGWHFITSLTTVQLGTPVRVHRVALVGVYSDAEQARVGL
jgi:hypothetical protein